MKISTNQEQIEWFLTHAVEQVYPSKETLREKLARGERMTVYLGVDPSGPTLHLGHAIAMQKLRELQDMGHRVILLIGNFTAMIGDPTDKLATRRQLTHEQVMENCKEYQAQAAAILRFDGENPIELMFNNDWLGKMSFVDVVELAAHFTVQQMMERDMFEKRMMDGKPVHLHEFLYPLMQGYDSVAMDVDLEVGGNDQTFNMLAGRTLMRELKQKEKAVLTCRLLTDPTGKKMGKSEGNMITLNDSSDEIYGKVMSWTDEMIIPGFEICTQMSNESLEEVRQALRRGENPMQWKRFLAHRIVSWLRGEEAANHAAEAFSRVHQHGETPEEVKEFTIDVPELPLVDALVLSELVPSKTEARRQIEQGAIKVNGDVVTDAKISVSVTAAGVLIQKGKRHFIKLIK